MANIAAKEMIKSNLEDVQRHETSRKKSLAKHYHFLGGCGNPFEKYAQIKVGSFPQVEAKNTKYLLPPPSIHDFDAKQPLCWR